ncbi:Pentatricopeptide repeat-containing protein, mitochondrial [Vitis vinifera]|uniref:Pentatricopeptide repeat-containing protein, mitochondrial n=1 Tax=Vitis vinifera TaxID=29760 RepID=A0A438JX57_VITVI|nr:Pentatricopeptide repeat-containing protein, mitochondrial [Vitis vinifera]
MPERNIIASNSMIVLLGKMGQVMEAWKLFNEMDEKDMVSWSALISGYEQMGFEKARALFDVMPEKDIVSWSALGQIKLDETILVSVISAYTHLAALIKARARKASGNNTDDNEAKERGPENIMAVRKRAAQVGER